MARGSARCAAGVGGRAGGGALWIVDGELWIVDNGLWLAQLPEEQRAELLKEYAHGMLDISKKAQELHVDVGALKATLTTLTDTTRQVSQEGNSVTVSHTQTTSVGRTEIIMGNTDNARVGKLSRSQTGERDWTPLYIVVGLLALVLIVSALAR